MHVFEREPLPGGLLRYGIPDFKMEKHHIDRRVAQMRGEGVVFHCGSDIGVSVALDEIMGHDAVVLAVGAEAPRDPGIPGQDLEGVHYAMPFLVQQNRRLGAEPVIPEAPVSAEGKHVVVIGGGDTASDCVGTSFRQGALSVAQMDIRPMPPEREDKLMVWPYWPTRMRTSSSQAEGAGREFAAATLALQGEDGRVSRVLCARVDERRRPIAGSEFHLPADLVLLAIGFAGPQTAGLLAQLAPELDYRGNIRADTLSYRTSVDKVFAAGDVRRGQSLVVWAIREGRQAARAVDEFLIGASTLPR